MQVSSKAIVLSALKYSDSSTIVTVFTEDFGKMSYMVYGAHRKKSKIKAAFLQPLSIVEIQATHKPTNNIQQLHDMRMLASLPNISMHPVKNAMALYMAELISKCTHQTTSDPSFFEFIKLSVEYLDVCDEHFVNFHLVFTLKLTRHLGFYPSMNKAQPACFDMLNGTFSSMRPIHNHYLINDELRNFIALYNIDYSNMGTLTLGREARFKLLNCLLEFYKLQVPEFYELKSVAVLHELFD
jgi:DNA repair protein RecO (recombination protein O)